MVAADAKITKRGLIKKRVIIKGERRDEKFIKNAVRITVIQIPSQIILDEITLYKQTGCRKKYYEEAL